MSDWMRCGTARRRLTARASPICRRAAAFLTRLEKLDEEKSVGFRVLMPDDDWLYLEGEVKHHSMKGFGVQFTELNEEQTEKLLWLLRIAQEAGPMDAPISADLVEE